MWLDSCVYDQGSLALPVLGNRAGTNTMNIVGWVAASEDRPEEITKRFRDEPRVIDNDDQGKLVDGLFRVKCLAKRFHVMIVRTWAWLAGRSFDSQYAGNANPGILESWWQREVRW